jgi:hypothetical protein
MSGAGVDHDAPLLSRWLLGYTKGAPGKMGTPDKTPAKPMADAIMVADVTSKRAVVQDTEAFLES